MLDYKGVKVKADRKYADCGKTIKKVIFAGQQASNITADIGAVIDV